jgi:hypothetical protein
MDTFMRVFIPIFTLTLVVAGLVFSYKGIKQKNKIKELELQKEILELEAEKDNIKIKLLEEENKKYNRIINEEP